MVTKVLTNYARVLMFLEDLVSLPEDCGQNSAGEKKGIAQAENKQARDENNARKSPKKGNFFFTSFLCLVACVLYVSAVI